MCCIWGPHAGTIQSSSIGREGWLPHEPWMMIHGDPRIYIDVHGDSQIRATDLWYTDLVLMVTHLKVIKY